MDWSKKANKQQILHYDHPHDLPPRSFELHDPTGVLVRVLSRGRLPDRARPPSRLQVRGQDPRDVQAPRCAKSNAAR